MLKYFFFGLVAENHELAEGAVRRRIGVSVADVVDRCRGSMLGARSRKLGGTRSTNDERTCLKYYT